MTCVDKLQKTIPSIKLIKLIATFNSENSTLQTSNTKQGTLNLIAVTL